MNYSLLKKYLKLSLVVILFSWITSGPLFAVAANVSSGGSADLELDKSVQITYPPATKTNHLPIGSLERVDSNHEAIGWALDPDSPTSSVEVLLYINGPLNQGQLIGSTTANLPRADINQHTGYSGDHGFSITIPSQYFQSSTIELFAYAIDLQTSDLSELSYLGTNVFSTTTATNNPPTFFAISLLTLPAQILSTPQAAHTVSLISTAVVVPAGTLGNMPIQLVMEIFSLDGLTELLWFLRRLWLGLLTLLGLRKKRHPWGTVYNSKTKQPLDPAVVTLYDAQTGQKVEEAITDLAGRFGFLVRSGSFKISAQKANYKFPSSFITGNDDGIFDHVYHGEVFNINEQSDVVTPNIPMDQVGFDWNEAEKTRLNIEGKKPHTVLETLVSWTLSLLFWAGVILTLMAFAAARDGISYLLLFICSLMIIYKYISHKQRLWGRLTFNSHPLAGYLLQVSHVEMPTIRLARAVTAVDGKFFLRTIPGKYLLSLYDPQKQLVKQWVMVGEKQGVFNRDIKLN